MKQKSKISKVFDPKMWLYDLVKIAGGWPVILEQRTKKIFLNESAKKDWYKGRFIVCANHRSFMDPLIVMNLFWKRRVVFIVAKEVLKKKSMNRFLRKVGMIKLDRENVTIETFKKAKEVLDRGHIVGIFPESHVKEQDDIREFAPGTVMMSVICDAPILPIYIVKREKAVNRQVIIIGNKIDYKQYTKGEYPTMDQIRDVTQVIKNEEIKLQEKYKQWKELNK